MAVMHELLAVEADLNKTQAKMMAEAMNTFSKKADHFEGRVRKTEYLDAERELENTQDVKAMVTTVDDKINYALGHFGKYIDALLQKTKTNQDANADLVVNGKSLAAGLPSEFLLSLEQKLTDVRAVLLEIPTLNPGIVWQATPEKGAGVFTSAPQEQMKTEKIEEYPIIVPATDKHPAQVAKVTKDKNVAKVITTITNGMWTSARKAKVLDNLDALIISAKKARQRANLAEVKPAQIADTLIAALLAD